MKKKQGASTFEGGEGATAAVTVVKKKGQAPRMANKGDPQLRQKKRHNQDLRWSGVQAGKKK